MDMNVTAKKSCKDKNETQDCEYLTPLRRPLANIKNHPFFTQSHSTIPRNKLCKIFQHQGNSNAENNDPSTKSSFFGRTFTPPTKWDHYTCFKTDTPSKSGLAASPHLELSNQKSSGQSTPARSGYYNPFETKAHYLQLPTVSPSIFQEVVSPNKPSDSAFKWTFEQMAMLYPAFTEVSPSQLAADQPVNPEYEKAAQEAIDKFFSNPEILPSPWTNSNSMSGALLPEASPMLNILQQKKEEISIRTNVWSQTELSLPPVLPTHVEEALAPFCTFTQDQTCQNNSSDEELVNTSANLNTTSLRRKLLFDKDTNHSLMSGSNSREITINQDDTSKSEDINIQASTPSPLPKYEDNLPWEDDVIEVSTTAQRYFTSPSQPELQNSFSIEEFSPIKSAGMCSSFTSSPGISPIKSLKSEVETIRTPINSDRIFNISHDSIEPEIQNSIGTHDIITESHITNEEKVQNISLVNVEEDENRMIETDTANCNKDKNDSTLFFTQDTHVNASCSEVDMSTSQLDEECENCDKLQRQSTGSVRYFSCFDESGIKERSCSITSIGDIQEKWLNGHKPEKHKLESSPSITASSAQTSSVYGTPSSAQFSSSPIKGGSYLGTPGDADTPTKFSSSPPVSPILWRSTIRQPFNHPIIEESANCLAYEAFEDSQVNTPMNVDADSKPFIESISIEDGSSQDTGYNTGSWTTFGGISQSSSIQSGLLSSDSTTNLRCFDQDRSMLSMPGHN